MLLHDGPALFDAAGRFPHLHAVAFGVGVRFVNLVQVVQPTG